MWLLEGNQNKKRKLRSELKERYVPIQKLASKTYADLHYKDKIITDNDVKFRNVQGEHEHFKTYQPSYLRETTDLRKSPKQIKKYIEREYG